MTTQPGGWWGAEGSSRGRGKGRRFSTETPAKTRDRLLRAGPRGEDGRGCRVGVRGECGGGVLQQLVLYCEGERRMRGPETAQARPVCGRLSQSGGPRAWLGGGGFKFCQCHMPRRGQGLHSQRLGRVGGACAACLGQAADGGWARLARTDNIPTRIRTNIPTRIRTLVTACTTVECTCSLCTLVHWAGGDREEIPARQANMHRLGGCAC